MFCIHSIRWGSFYETEKIYDFFVIFFVKRSPEYREHQGPVPVYGQLDWRTYSKVFKPVHYKIIKKKNLWGKISKNYTPLLRIISTSCISTCTSSLHVAKLNFGHCPCVEHFYGSHKARLYVPFLCSLYGYTNTLFLVWKYKFIPYMGIEYVFMINRFDITPSTNHLSCHGILWYSLLSILSLCVASLDTVLFLNFKSMSWNTKTC